MTRLRRDTLFRRLMGLQLAVALLVVAALLVLVFYERARAEARATAPLWAAALAEVAARPGGAPSATPDVHVVPVQTRVELRVGHPPQDAVRGPLMPRYRLLLEELRTLGVPVDAVALSGRTGEAITWLRVSSDPQDPWVGVVGEFEGVDARQRGALGVVLAVVLMVLGAWLVARRIVAPLVDLQRDLAGFLRHGEMPRDPAPGTDAGPAEIRTLRHQFADLARERHAAERERALMLAGISHDLRSPLARIRLAAELLADGPDAQASREAIVRNVRVLDRLLDSFIDMARVDEVTLADRVDLAALARAVVESYGECDLTLEVTTAIPVQPANAWLLERSLRNLIENARRWGRPPVIVSVTTHGDRVELAVRDHGPGVAPQDRARLVRPFERGDAGRREPGSGLGLAVADRTATRHGGHLRLDDAAPGLRVTLSLPASVAVPMGSGPAQRPR